MANHENAWSTMRTFNKFAKPTLILASGVLSFGCASEVPKETNSEIGQRVHVAAANMQDAVVVDCQLPGQLIALGGSRQYLAPGKLTRLSAIDCRTRGGEYVVGDLASGTLSLSRWLPLAEQGDVEAQYYVARIYANAMSGVPLDYAKAAEWYQRAADKDYAPAMQELGYLFESGLGVPQDQLRGLNLQRKASGLGDQLDYEFKITAAKDEYEQKTKELGAQLETSNTELEVLRNEQARLRDQLSQSRGRLALAESAVLSLRGQSQAAQSDGDGAARAKALESKLAASEEELAKARRDNDVVRVQLVAQQNQLQAQLLQSQSANTQLDQLVISGQDEAKSLRARLAQSEQRLIQSQQELADVRLDYRHQVEQLTAERDNLERARAKTNDNAGAALLAAKEHDLALQSLRVKSMESEIAALKQANADTAAQVGKAAQSGLQVALLRTNLAVLEDRYKDQENALKAAQSELTTLRAKSQSERADIFNRLSADLAARTNELAQKQRQIDSLEANTGMLKGELSRLRDEQTRQAAAVATETESTRTELEKSMAQLRDAQQKLADQRDQLDQLRTESAKERAALLREQIDLQQRLTAGEAADERDVALMKAAIAEREKLIASKDARIAELEKNTPQPPPPVALTASNNVKVPMRQVNVTANYYALVIGNSHYANMNALATPTHDAQTIADLLTRRYGFKTTMMLDATSDQIGAALDRLTDLKETDRLLIYYAGHGGPRFGPPERAFWFGVDADPNNSLRWIPADYVSEKIKQMKAKQILLVSDSCFAASITHANSTTIVHATTEERFRMQWDRRARMVLTSGENSPVADTSGDQNYSLFAKYFISVLQENDGLMSGETLAGEIASRMAPEAKRMGIKQSPTYTKLQDPSVNLGEFFFLPPANPVQLTALNE